MKTFQIAARKKGRKKPIPFKLNEYEEETYYVNPNASEDALAVLYVDFLSEEGERSAAPLLEVMKTVFTEDTFTLLRRRVLDGELELSALIEPTLWAAGELSGRPTKSQSD